MGGTTQQLRRTTAPATPAPQRRAWWWPVPAIAGALAVVAGILPAGWPAGAALGVLAMVLGARGMRRGPAWHGFGAARTGVVFGLIGLLFGFFLVLPWLGQIVSGAIFSLLLIRLLSNLGWVRIAIYAVVLSVAVDLVFAFLLNVPLPRGIFGF